MKPNWKLILHCAEALRAALDEFISAVQPPLTDSDSKPLTASIRRYPKSKIDCLDSDIRRQVETMLSSNIHTYKEIADYLRQHGVSASGSVLSRYHRRMKLQKRI